MFRVISGINQYEKGMEFASEQQAINYAQDHNLILVYPSGKMISFHRGLATTIKRAA